MPSVRANLPWRIFVLLGTVIFGIVMSIAFSNELAALLHEPLMTPDAWLKSHPYLQIGNHIVNEPSSSVHIFLLAILYLRVVYLFFRRHDGQQSRLWWGIFMLLFGLGAILAGVLLIEVIVIYFIGLTSGYAAHLWARGIWFNANDLLHLLLFGWVLYSYNMLHENLLDS